MRLLKRTVTAVALVVAAPGLLWAQDDGNPVQIPSDNTGYGTTSAEFLEFGASARGMALGGAFSTIVDDVSALHYNPANLVFMPGVQAALTVMPYFADTDYYWAGLAFPFSDNDFGFGVFLGRFGFGDQPIYTEADEDGLSGETYGVNEVVAGLSFAHAFIDRFSAGATVKFISDDLAGGALAGAKASTAAMDFGVNFHSELWNNPINQGAQCGMGGEFGWESLDSPIGGWLRGSYTTQPDNEDLGGIDASNTGLDGMAFGGGLFYRIADRYRLQVDYAYKHYGALGSVDAFTFTIGWE